MILTRHYPPCAAVATLLRLRCPAAPQAITQAIGAHILIVCENM
jgi:hypothetical protein